MDCADHHLFSGTGLPHHQKVHVVIIRQDTDLMPDRFDLRADADQLLRIQLQEFQGSPAVPLLHAAADHHVDLLQVEGLLHIVAHAPLHGLHRLKDRPVGRHEDHHDILVDPPEILHMIQPGLALQPVVEKHRVRAEFLRDPERLPDGLRSPDLISQIRHTAFQGHSEQMLVIHDQKSVFHLSPPYCRRRS